MKPHWSLKIDPVHQPVRFLSHLWQQGLAANFGIVNKAMTPREYGQLKSLRKFLDDLAPDVIRWMVHPLNWNRFCQQVQAELGLHHTPPEPQIGFLLRHHPIGLRVMRRELLTSGEWADFVRRLDQRSYNELKTLLTVFADGIPERLARIEEAKTLADIQMLFIEIVGESTASALAADSSGALEDRVKKIAVNFIQQASTQGDFTGLGEAPK